MDYEATERPAETERAAGERNSHSGPKEERERNGTDNAPSTDGSQESQQRIEYRMLRFDGATDTHKPDTEFPNEKTGTPYDTISFSEIVAMAKNPACVEKKDKDGKPGKVPSFIPSTYHEADGRSFAVQAAKGEFALFSADIDSGNHSLEAILTATTAIFGPRVEMLVYSTTSAAPDEKKWRILAPLKDTITGDDREPTQMAFFGLMKDHGIECDTSLAREGQTHYLPNVPPSRCDEWGGPIYYVQHHRAGLPIELHPAHPIILRANEIAAAQAEEEKAIAAAAAARAARRTEAVANGAGKESDRLIDWFNAQHTAEQLMHKYGYKVLKTGKRLNYQSPLQKSGSYATKLVNDGKTFITLSASDMAAGLGQQSRSKTSHFGDAYDLFAHYEHQNDHEAAFRSIRKMMPREQFDPVKDFETYQAQAEEFRESEGGGDKGAGSAESATDDAKSGAGDNGDTEGKAAGDNGGTGGKAAGDNGDKPDGGRFEWITDRSNAEPVLDGNWLVKNMVPAEGLGVLYGRPGSGKTFTVLDIALHIATGLPWRGLRVEEGGVSYISPEAGRMGVNRVIGWMCHHDRRWPTRFRMSPAEINLCSTGEDAAALVADIKANQPDCRLVVVDTLNRAMAGGDENSGEDMGNFIKLCDRVGKEVGAFVLVVHHSGKDVAKGSRGHSSLLGAVGAEFEVTKEEGQAVGVVRVTKLRDGADGAEYGFRLSSIRLGQDRDGDPVTTAISLPADAGEARDVQATKPQGKNQKAVADAFAQYVADVGRPNPSGTGFAEPGRVMVVDADAFIEFAMGKIVSGKPAHEKRKTVRDAVEGLIAKRYFCVNGNLLWRL